MPMRIPTRVFFQKVGRLKYLAHLDMMRAYMRAISRAELPVWYTQGYNPQIYLSFSLALSLGYQGLEESFDIYLLEELDSAEVAARMNRYLPEELAVLWTAPPVEKATAITWADYGLEFYFDQPQQKTADALAEYLSQPEIIVEKKTKRRTVDLDVKPYLLHPCLAVEDDHVALTARVATGNQFNINPRLFAEGFANWYQQTPRHVAYTRIAMQNSEEKPFR